MEANFEQRKLDLEHSRLDADNKQKELEFKKATLSSENQPPGSGKPFDVAIEIKLVPPFEESEVDKYVQQFETIALISEWPKNK